MIGEVDTEISTGRSELFLVLGVVELIFGISAVFLADYAAIFDQVVILAGSGGLLALACCVLRPRLVTVYDLLSAALLLAYGTGTLNSLISFSHDNQVLLPSTTIGQYWFTYTLGLTLAVCGALHLAGRLDYGGRLFIDNIAQTPISSRFSWFAIVCLILVCWELATGHIGFMASVTADIGSPAISVFPTIILMLMTPVGAIAISEALKPGTRYKKALCTIGMFLLLLQFGLGRRVFLFSLLTCVMCAVATRPPKKWLAARPLILAIGGIVLLQAATVAFYTLRIVSWSLHTSPTARVQLLSIIPQAYKEYTSDTRGEIKEKIAENLKSRTFVLEYLVQITRGEATYGPLHGEDFHRAFIDAIPSAFYREKYRDPLFLQEEELINPKFGLPVWDAANSILTAGVADFGWIGLFLYPLTLCLLLSIVLQVIRSRLSYETPLLLSLATCQLLLSVESDISTYVSFIRTLIVLGAISWLMFRNDANRGAICPVGARESSC